MTPQEKAKELVDRFEQRFPLKSEVITTKGDLSWEYDNWEEAKQCALIAVDEILEIDLPIFEEDADEFYDYWQEVKQEICDL